ncbi:MAG: hypothetical protein FVQ84_02475 [Planctomycetes bacterium]|nr:hypothetical protein [Planctomycetota bacterium]
MPFTPYHFGPSGFLGLVFRKWIDIPVFVLANVIVDVEVLVVMIFGLGWPPHRYCHTLLIGGVVGMLWGIAAYPLRHIFKKIMRIFHIPYKPHFLKMVISGIIGVWLHVLIDGFCHIDLRIFWPSKEFNWSFTPLGIITYIFTGHIYRNVISIKELETICIAFFFASFIVYIIILLTSKKNVVKNKMSKEE